MAEMLIKQVNSKIIMMDSKQRFEHILEKAQQAFGAIEKLGIAKRVAFMRTIADEIEALGPELVKTAHEETKLPEFRLTGERARTIFQWRSYADALERGTPLDVSIDTANAERTPPKPDVRKTSVGLGPVTVFGSSNFPFAFSTAGGDTASAIAAGCPVILKVHPGHPKTSQIMADAIARAIQKSNFPEGTFSHVFCDTYEEAQLLVSHPIVKAVGFTGSTRGGMALLEVASKRPEPIPVYAEMGSINPVFLLPSKLRSEASALAREYVNSLTVGVGQLCTNPGLAIGIQSPGLDAFVETFREEIAHSTPAPMLNPGIAKAYFSNRDLLMAQDGVDMIATAEAEAADGCAIPTVVTASGADFLLNDTLQEEVFGPFALIVKCKDTDEMLAVTEKLHGQLTATLLATDEDLADHGALIATIQKKCGRIIFNNFPTGVEVCKSMNHSGPFPSSSTIQFTSVGSDSIKRFIRPLSYQNWPDAFLPEELKNSNPLGIWRTVNGVPDKAALV